MTWFRYNQTSNIKHQTDSTALTHSLYYSIDVYRHIIIFWTKVLFENKNVHNLTLWLVFIFWHGILYWKKMSLIKSSLLNITRDFSFHLFYCFSPCPLSLPHTLLVFNPPLKTFISSSLLFCESSSEVSVPTQHSLETVPAERSPCMLSGVSLQPSQSGWICCQGWSGIS